MKRWGFVTVMASLVCIASAMPVHAHHSFASAFDADQPITIRGVIIEVRLENPHSWFFLDVKDAGGKVVRWGFEGQTPTSLIRSGLKPGFLKAGDEVTIKGWHARDASQNIGCARELIMADGRAFAIGPVVGAGTR
jgi:hypothetical protein